MADAPQTQHSMLQSKFPVSVPEMPELKYAKDEFMAYLKSLSTSNLDNIRKLSVTDIETPGDGDAKNGRTVQDAPQSAFMKGLLSSKKVVPSFDEQDGKMLTDNRDVSHRTSGEPLVDLFYELQEGTAESTLSKLLDAAWAADPDATLKLIWNARSIHLGKSNRNAFYRAVGWLYQEHPVTLLTNLQWLVRPIIQKKAPKPDQNTKPKDEGIVNVKEEDYDSDFTMIDDDAEIIESKDSKKRKLSEMESDDAEFDVKFGVAHGYWKDLLNILVLAARDELRLGGTPRSILNTEKPKEKKYKRDWTEGKKKETNKERHEAVEKKLSEDPKYKALHLCVARLFAAQLKLDLARLEKGNKSDIKKVTLAGKWAPSNKGMHDQHTTIVSSIAELLHPLDTVCPDVDPADRDLYLKHARNAYQTKTLSTLRKQLEIVERNITGKTFEQINYDRVPSLAMKQHQSTFAKKDFDRFDKYIDDVAQGKAKISGVVLLPSVMVAEALGSNFSNSTCGAGINERIQQKLQEVAAKTTSGQWGALVQRIKDSGTLADSIAVCDVSGSMYAPRFADGTRPMDASIGLSLLIAEVTKPPFGGSFITFDSEPQILRVGGESDTRSFAEKVRYISSAPWGMSTDFVAVFETLILPMAVKNKLKQEDMVKQVFVFSDMQFDAATRDDDRWATSYERIQDEYKKHGYEMPKLIFWNLAGSHTADHVFGRLGGNMPKPVTADQEGTALVSGYSQGQLKMFLDKGQFEDAEDEETIETKDMGEDGEEIVKSTKKAKDDPLATVRKAISHDAYRMLKVVD
ncbi:Putative von Willebrand factor A-like domain superfamily [Septoria linicola]|uniref:von Willebrand factor A-like domain superfamily n=1 Tax=Septoria linicola TaxID=215465 RepID=A0A9Q9B8E6_9PEZI|nr:putative von Willebrand factor A-like domain superfamily [Septoria linicola]USW58956.1 Putative von Willebrand factor A-like domain superfamily [Septoria linicola]